MAKKQKNYFLNEEFIEQLETQASVRGIPVVQVMEKDLAEIWSLKERQERTVNQKLDSIEEKVNVLVKHSTNS
jgi:hypothetical protein